MKDLSKSKNFEEAKTFTGGTGARLPVGGYVLRIADISEKSYDWGSVFVLEFDIAEGEFANFFTENYADQTDENKKWKGTARLNIPKDDGSEKDNITMRIFKTAIADFEESNPNFHWNWDEKTLKGKLIGGLFGNKEYDYNGKQGFFTECAYFTSVQNIRDDKFKIPKDKLLNKQASNLADFKAKVDGLKDEELPF